MNGRVGCVALVCCVVCPRDRWISFFPCGQLSHPHLIVVDLLSECHSGVESGLIIAESRTTRGVQSRMRKTMIQKYNATFTNLYRALCGSR